MNITAAYRTRFGSVTGQSNQRMLQKVLTLADMEAISEKRTSRIARAYLVSRTSEMDGDLSGVAWPVHGYVHSLALAGQTGLGFNPPSVLDGLPEISDIVFFLLNANLPDSFAFKTLGPASQ